MKRIENFCKDHMFTLVAVIGVFAGIDVVLNILKFLKGV